MNCQLPVSVTMFVNALPVLLLPPQAGSIRVQPSNRTQQHRCDLLFTRPDTRPLMTFCMMFDVRTLTSDQTEWFEAGVHPADARRKLR